jgi:hypothetical protein
MGAVFISAYAASCAICKEKREARVSTIVAVDFLDVAQSSSLLITVLLPSSFSARLPIFHLPSYHPTTSLARKYFYRDL